MPSSRCSPADFPEYPEQALPPGVSLLEGFLSLEESTVLRQHCLSRLRWERPTVTMFGRSHPVPRELAFVAQAHAVYGYSGIVHEGVGVPGFCADLLDRVASAAGAPFDAILLTRYRTGDDRLGWHADDEPELGPDPILAILSLGASRTLRFRRRVEALGRGNAPPAICSVDLPDRSLLLMGSGVQQAFEHEVPRRRGRGERISLGFRSLVGARPVS